MNILMAEHTHYESVCRVGCHHLAEGFARRGHQVFYISSYLTPLHVLHWMTKKSPATTRRFLNWLSNGKQWSEQLYSYVPFTLFPFTRRPLLDSSRIAAWQFPWTFPSLKKKLPRTFDAILIGDPRFLPLLDSVEALVKIFRLTDDVLSIASTPRSTIDLLKEGLPKCTHVFVTAKNLCSVLEKDCGFTRAVHMPNGVDFAHFAKDRTDQEEPSDLSEIPNPRVVYAGSIDERIDLDLVEFCAKKLPAVSFVFIGPNYLNVRKLKNCANIYFLQPCAYQDLPCYLASSQAAMIPFRKNKRTDSMCSIKLLQYLAADLPTIATRLLELESQRAPIYLAKDREEFALHIEAALAESKNTKKHQEFARLFSWDQNVEEIERCILSGTPRIT